MSEQPTIEFVLPLEQESTSLRGTSRSDVWRALKFVLLNRAQFLSTCGTVEVLSDVKTEDKETYTLKVKHSTGSEIIEKIELIEPDSATTYIEAGEQYDRLVLHISIENGPDGEFWLRFHYTGGPKEGQIPNQYLHLIHAAWKAKDEEIVQGIRDALEHPTT